MSNRVLNYQEYAKTARLASAEGCVLLKNEGQALPLKKGEKIAVFGRLAFYYYKSGMGSGGLVNTRYVTNIPDALQENGEVILDEILLKQYHQWIEKHPADEGQGWGTEPWSQEEMPVDPELVRRASKDADAALVVIGRTAGEDRDNTADRGSYLLTETEETLVKEVCQTFQRSIIILNVGNIIDMSWVEKYQPSAVLYVWQGGQEGGNGVADVLLGRVNPCGRLTDTIAEKIEDYPSTAYYGDSRKNYYKEDIFVGYRYFETFQKEKVIYPFGFGLSYTEFVLTDQNFIEENDQVIVTAKVRNTGETAGKEVVQVYIGAPFKETLSKAARVLVGFCKTKLLQPQEECEIKITCQKSDFASYDDTGCTGHKNCFLLEEGKYDIYVGKNVRDAKYLGTYEQKEIIISKTSAALAPVEDFERMIMKADEYGNKVQGFESLQGSKRNTDSEAQKEDNCWEKDACHEISFTGDKGISFLDVKEGKASVDELIAQLSDEEMIYLFHGEGMCSLKVTAGTAGAFGGVTDSLSKYEIPVACCADGPSGIRMDCGSEAFSLPNGTALGCTFDTELVEKLYSFLGLEMIYNKVDVLLGPGMNIHRNPLNGRNFEYISEDPYLTGKMAAAQLKGLNQYGAQGTVKHFCANNQEKNRVDVEAVVSERALREIYLKGFEIAVKEGNAKSVMTTYGPINGIWTAGNYDLCTTILREEWGFDGIVMTDWWGMANWPGELPQKENRAVMLLAQNDLYMCCPNVEEESKKDDVAECLKSGTLQRRHLQRSAKNIIKFLLQTPVADTYGDKIERVDFDRKTSDAEVQQVLPVREAKPEGIVMDDEKEVKSMWQQGAMVGIVMKKGSYKLKLRFRSKSGSLAQIPISIYIDNICRKTFSLRGTSGEWIWHEEELGEFLEGTRYVRFVCREKGTEAASIGLEAVEVTR